MVTEHGAAGPLESKPSSLVLTLPESLQGAADIPLQGINESISICHLTLLSFESERRDLTVGLGESKERLQNLVGDAMPWNLQARPFAGSHLRFIACLLYYYLFLPLISDSHPVVISNCLPSHHSVLTSKCHPCLIDIYYS